MLAGLAKEDGKTGKEGGTRARRTTVGSTVAAVGYVSVGSTVAGVGNGHDKMNYICNYGHDKMNSLPI